MPIRIRPPKHLDRSVPTGLSTAVPKGIGRRFAPENRSAARGWVPGRQPPWAEFLLWAVPAVVGLAARLGVSALLTLALAAALDLYVGLEPWDPRSVRVCAGFFLWCSLLVTATCLGQDQGNGDRVRRLPGGR
jgi:hypothetical protein